jgi:shikimate dehydrogenase
MRKFGLIGYPLGHSFSPKYFGERFEKEGILDCEYKAYPLQHILEVQKVIDDNLDGFNVTLPYKEDVIDFLSELNECALAIGAVNCVKNTNGVLRGYNTDQYGFQLSLLDLIGKDFDGKALVLGTGGAAKAVYYALDQLKISYKIVSRRSDFITYEQLTPALMEEHSLIINATPVGMFPNVEECPNILYEYLTKDHFLYDLVYNPEQTLFLKKGEKMGSSIKNGQDMLILQAEKSWEIWNQL